MPAGCLRRFALSVLLFLLVPFAPAQILLRAAGSNFQPLRTKSLQAKTVISKGLATTALTLTFENTIERRIEADFIYTVRPATLVTGFAYWFGGEKVVARVVEKERASEIYRAITRPARDPALIELIGKRTFRARIFPVMPKADLKVEIQLVQPLEDGKTFVLPTKMPKGEQLNLFDVQVRIDDASDWKISTSLPMTAEGDATKTLSLRAESFRPQEDLKISIERPKPKIADTFFAAKSGGVDGFFAFLAAKPANVKQARVEISGGSTYSVTPAVLTSKEPALVTGRYKKSGKGVLRIGGQLLGEVAFTSTSIPNNAASKLWAAAQIEGLGGTDRARDRVVALSTRYTIPSKFTSWLAIPEAERAAFERTIKFSRVSQLARLIAEEVAAGRDETPKTHRMRARFDSLAREMKLEPKALVAQYLNEKREAVMETLSKEYAAFRFESKIAMASRRSLHRMNAWTGQGEQVYGYPVIQRLQELAEKVVEAQLKRDSAAERQARQRLDLLAKRSGNSAQEHYVDRVRGRLLPLADQVIDARLSGKPEEEPMSQLSMLAKNIRVPVDQQLDSSIANKIQTEAYLVAAGFRGASPEAMQGRLAKLDQLLAFAHRTRTDALDPMLTWQLQSIATERENSHPVHLEPAPLMAEANRLQQLVGVTDDRLTKIAERLIATSAANAAAKDLASEIAANRENSERATELRATLELEAAKSDRRANDFLQSHLWAHYWRVTGEYQEAVADHGLDSAEATAHYKALQHISSANKQKLDREQVLTQKLYALAGELHWAKSAANLNEREIGRAEARIQRLNAATRNKIAKQVSEMLAQGYGPEGDARQALLKELRKGHPDEKRVEQLAKEMTWASLRETTSDYGKQRVERLKAEVMLDKLEDEPRTPEVEAQIAAYTRIRDEMRAKMGDPLIISNAPKTAKSVIAIMPSGEIKRLDWNALSKRWEARFDIPDGVDDGRYEIRIVAVLADGSRSTESMTYTVDNTPPTGISSVQRQGLQVTLEIETSADTARVEAVLPSGVTPFVKVREGLFRLTIQVAAADFAVWLTDKAHNRAELKIKT